MADTEKPLFPEKLYIYPCDYDDDNPIFAIAENLADADEGDVALYQLVKAGKKKLTHKFQGK